MTDLPLVGTPSPASVPADRQARGATRDAAAARGAHTEAFAGCRADPFAVTWAPRSGLRLRLNSPYGLGAFVGLITYLSYGYLNLAWSNWVLVAISVFMFLSLPLYSQYSNRIESLAARLTQLETGGRVARYLFQFIDNIVLLWVYVVGDVIDPAALEGIGGFFATAAWITIVSQGGQYLANHLARKGIGNPDRNVVCAIAVSVTVSALAVSGVRWIQPLYVAISLGAGALIFGVGVMRDTRRLVERQKASVSPPRI